MKKEDILQTINQIGFNFTDIIYREEDGLTLTEITVYGKRQIKFASLADALGMKRTTSPLDPSWCSPDAWTHLLAHHGLPEDIYWKPSFGLTSSEMVDGCHAVRLMLEYIEDHYLDFKASNKAENSLQASTVNTCADKTTATLHMIGSKPNGWLTDAVKRFSDKYRLNKNESVSKEMIKIFLSELPEGCSTSIESARVKFCEQGYKRARNNMMQ